ncbi:unnamed protein product [Pieris macdunnoughi]|uniref:Uncharacterized protein n=1 Tax=Pieris macdunnoughi TaxID=345717 RepID=A0A821SBT6_9NEOP|nr:unnamed protein product [Pieris macdunnoughi]
MLAGHFERMGPDWVVKEAYLRQPSGWRPLGLPTYRWIDRGGPTAAESQQLVGGSIGKRVLENAYFEGEDTGSQNQ